MDGEMSENPETKGNAHAARATRVARAQSRQPERSKQAHLPDVDACTRVSARRAKLAAQRLRSSVMKNLLVLTIAAVGAVLLLGKRNRAQTRRERSEEMEDLGRWENEGGNPPPKPVLE